MNILIVGSGGREHALAWKLSQSPEVDLVYIAPGNAGTAEVGENVNISAGEIHGLMTFAKENKVEVTVVGPEAPLADGITDYFEEKGLRIFGPSQKAAMLESSKSFAKKVMRSHNIPTAPAQTFSNLEKVKNYLEFAEYPVVIKASGLAQGKGVIVCEDEKEAVETVYAMMEDRIFGRAGEEVIIEEFLRGEEASILFFTDSSTILPLATSQDHKLAFDRDKGSNTGGMGAYSPAPVVSNEVMARIESSILVPTVHALKRENAPYKGLLYAGLMISDKIPKVLEYNVRFGDPEAQPILMRMKSDLMDPILKTLDGNLDESIVEWNEQAAVCVVLASGGYPNEYEKGFPITGIKEAEALSGVKVFHAGTTMKRGELITSGGRVLGVTALGDTIQEAKQKAYEAVSKIHFEKMHYRTDISDKAARHF